MNSKPDGRAITWPDGSIMKDTIVWGDNFFESEYVENVMVEKAFAIVHRVPELNLNDAIHRKAWDEFIKDARYKLVEFDLVARQK